MDGGEEREEGEGTHSWWGFENGLEVAHSLIRAVDAEGTLDLGCCL